MIGGGYRRSDLAPWATGNSGGHWRGSEAPPRTSRGRPDYGNLAWGKMMGDSFLQVPTSYKSNQLKKYSRVPNEFFLSNMKVRGSGSLVRRTN